MAIRNLRPQSIFGGFGNSMGYMDEDFMGPQDFMGPMEPPLESGAYVPMARNPIGTSRLNVADLPPGVPPQNPEAAQFFRSEMSRPQEENWLDIVNRLDSPETFANERFNRFIDEYPQYEKPSLARKFAASAAGIGNIRMGRPGGVEAAEQVMYAPHRRDVADWKMRAQPMYEAANLERQANIGERQLLAQGVTAELAQAKLNEAQRKAMAQEAINRDKVALIAEKQNGTTYTTEGGKIIAHKMDGTIYDTGQDVKNYTPLEVANLLAKNRIEVANIQGATQRATADIGAASREIYNIPDPADPTKQIAVRLDPITKKAIPIQMEGQNISGATKLGGAGGDFTSSTKTMMEGAKMLLPHITELRNQAADLDKRGLFGPVMSRIRNLAAKVGTTGTPEEVEKSLNEFSNAIVSDPLINSSNDEAVGRFALSLGLMASGAGRVHGGARGGGSIQMINYMKALLSADSTLKMFNGRMDALDSYMKGYAVGPGGATTGKKDRLDAIIEDILRKK